MEKNILYVICGGARTFLECYESIEENLITKLFPESKISILFYLKLTDPGPKGQHNWNFTYPSLNLDGVKRKIELIRQRTNFVIYDKIISGDEITDEELLQQVSSRDNYISFYSNDTTLARGMQCHYNFERCGNFIKNIENYNNISFDIFVYCRPDLLILSPAVKLDTELIDENIVARGPVKNNNDHLCVIPRKYFNNFFYMINKYRSDAQRTYSMPEDIYMEAIEPFKIISLCSYKIKR